MGENNNSAVIFSEEKLLKSVDEILERQTIAIRTTLLEFTEEIHREIGVLASRIDKLENKNLQLERATRKNNLIIFGIRGEGQINFEEVSSVFSKFLNVTLARADIVDIYRLGRYGSKNSPVKIEFAVASTRQNILKNSGKFRGSNIYVTSDLCEEDRRINRILVKRMKEARHNRFKAVISGNKLIIDGRAYTVEQLETSLPGICQRSNSAPSTPTPADRERQLLQEFGSTKLAVEYTTATKLEKSSVLLGTTEGDKESSNEEETASRDVEEVQWTQADLSEGRQQPVKGVLEPSVGSQSSISEVENQLGGSERNPQLSGGGIGRPDLMSSSSDTSAKFRSQKEVLEASKKVSKICRSGSVGSGERITRSQRAELKTKQARE